MSWKGTVLRCTSPSLWVEDRRGIPHFLFYLYVRVTRLKSPSTVPLVEDRLERTLRLPWVLWDRRTPGDACYLDLSYDNEVSLVSCRPSATITEIPDNESNVSFLVLSTKPKTPSTGSLTKDRENRVLYLSWVVLDLPIPGYFSFCSTRYTRTRSPGYHVVSLLLYRVTWEGVPLFSSHLIRRFLGRKPPLRTPWPKTNHFEPHDYSGL